MKLSFALSLSLSASAFAGGHFKVENSSLGYSDVRPIIQRSCAGCHAGINQEQNWIERRGTFLAVISSRTMPFRNPKFADSADGRKLLEWLRAGQEFQNLR